VQDEPTVTVYSFRVQGEHREDLRIAGFKATREAIRALKGDLLAGTGQQIRLAELDQQGRYRRVATGWGELE